VNIHTSNLVPYNTYKNTTHTYLCYTQADGITVNYVVTLCTSRWRSLWLGVLFGYKAIIQVIGVYLAFRIRKVTVRMLWLATS